MIDDKWITITNKFKRTCVVCNRAMMTGDLILWNKETSQSMHHPEMCKFLGTRKKMPSRRQTKAPLMNQKALDEKRLFDRIEQYTFPVEVRKIG